LIPVFEWVEVSKIRQVAGQTFVLSFKEPKSAKALNPGQFCMISPPPGTSNVYLPRPFSYYRVDDGENIQILFRTFGRATRWMAHLVPGNRIGVFGPLGTSFTVKPGIKRVILVAGGIGLPPLVLLSHKLVRLDDPPQVDLIYGERESSKVVDLSPAVPETVGCHICSEDGRIGFKGQTTELFEKIFSNCESPPAVYTCGPRPMMAALAGMIAPDEVSLFEVSMEENMACGMGICQGCVIAVKGQKEELRYVRCCTEGPVMDGFEVKWE